MKLKMLKKPFIKLISIKKFRKMHSSNELHNAGSLVRSITDSNFIENSIFSSLGLESINDVSTIKRTYHSLFDIMRKYEHRIDFALMKKEKKDVITGGTLGCTVSFNANPVDDNGKNNHAIGAFLFKVADLYEKGIIVFRNNDDLLILRKLVKYLEKIKYWKSPDVGLWNGEEALNASSVGACVAGLKRISRFIKIDDELIEKGMRTLKLLLPWESAEKHCDLALLSLIFPYNVVNEKQKASILKNVERTLVKENGVMRHKGDSFQNKAGEARWTVGLPWLAKIFKDMGDTKKYDHYINRTRKIMNWKGEIPDYFKSDSYFPEINKSNTWSTSMYLVATSC